MDDLHDARRVRITWRETSTDEAHETYTLPSDESWQTRLASAYNRVHHTRCWHVALVNRTGKGSYRVQMGHRVASANATTLQPEMSVWLYELEGDGNG